MNDTEKPFVCAKQGCNMTFTNEDHLNVHKKKHDMALHLGIDNQSNTVVADQTPTPTRFIRNCEEVGLFQDLQNVNPFDETFRKATELIKSGSLPVSEAPADDTLHTPHIFPPIEEKSLGKYSRNNSNEPEFTITTIDHDLLKLSSKSPSNEAKTSAEVEVLSIRDDSTDSETLDRNSYLVHTGRAISDSDTLISKDNLISNMVPTAIPAPSLFVNSDIPPVVVNNLSDIQISCKGKQASINKLYNKHDSEEKCLFGEIENDTIKMEEIDLDDCDSLGTCEQDDLLLTNNSNNLNLQSSMSPQKKTVTKHAARVPLKCKIPNNCNIRKSTQVVTGVNPQNKTAIRLQKTKAPVSQTRLERQREINRAAQLRSRQKKKCFINKMETEILNLEKETKQLVIENRRLKNEIMLLKTMLMYHKDCSVSKDPRIMEEIKLAVKSCQEEFQKKEEKQATCKKVVPICPSLTGVLAFAPVPNPVLIQVQTPVVLSTPNAVPVTTLPTLRAKPVPATKSVPVTKSVPAIKPAPAMKPATTSVLSITSKTATQSPRPTPTPNLRVKIFESNSTNTKRYKTTEAKKGGKITSKKQKAKSIPTPKILKDSFPLTNNFVFVNVENKNSYMN